MELVGHGRPRSAVAHDGVADDEELAPAGRERHLGRFPGGAQAPGEGGEVRVVADGGDFVKRAERLGIETLLTPFRAPKANAIAERIVRSIRNECLDHLIVLNETHLRVALAEFVRYYNLERPHRSLRLTPPVPVARARAGPVRSRPVLGGLHHVYERAA